MALCLFLATHPSGAQPLSSGERTFNVQCKACHAVGPNAKNRVGPQLNNLHGRKAGSVEGYKYSDALKNADIIWNEAEFSAYLKNPKQKFPGTKKFNPHVANEQIIKDIYEYLGTFN
ncbi:c-type cytochrome [Microvirga sp. W0021]|uniref:C-type cytochrome n=1 Tax=Hohaiivirga grylli TaxID=3133970 RepID=A0ABV0BJ83_9HYPH